MVQPKSTVNLLADVTWGKIQRDPIFSDTPALGFAGDPASKFGGNATGRVG